MFARRFPLGAVVFLCVATMLSTPALGCTYCNCRYYLDYLPDYNGGGCQSSACVLYCAGPQTLTAWNPQLPGIEVSNDAQPVIIAVYPNSPAEQAGIKVGDTLLAVNGKPVPYDCPSEPGLQEYLIRRDKRQMKIGVRPISPAEMLFDSRFTNVGLGGHNRLPSLLPYISGLTLRKTKGGTLVENVLPGTPADVAGFEKGWRVLAILDASTNQPSTAGEGADYRAKLKFVVTSGRIITTKTLTLHALSEVLSEVAAARNPATLAAALHQRQ